MRMYADIAALLPRTRRAILAVTFRDARRWWYMRELARQLAVPPSSLQRELASLVRGGILRRKREGKNVYFQAAADSPIFPELRGMIVKTVGLLDIIRYALQPFTKRIQWAFVYGSFARFEDHASSDVDLMIIGKVGLAALSSPLRKAEGKLQRAVNPTIYSAEEFAGMVRLLNHFALTVLRSKKLFVQGDPNEFGKAFGHSAPGASHPKPQRDDQPAQAGFSRLA